MKSRSIESGCAVSLLIALSVIVVIIGCVIKFVM